jgi:DNA polymerase
VLDETLLEAGLERDAVRITNCVRCRPPGNRDPTAGELENCREWLDREIDVVDPEVVVTLGKVPSEHLLGRSVAVTTETGTVEEARLGGAARRVLVSLHPAATLYDRSQERASLAGVDGSANGSGQSRIGEF